MLIEIWPGYWWKQSEIIKMRVDEVKKTKVKREDEENSTVFKDLFWKNIGCIIPELTFGVGGVILQDN